MPRILIAGEFPEEPPMTIGGIQAVAWELVSALDDVGGLELHVSACEKWWRNPRGREWERDFGGISAHYSTSPKRIPHVVTSWTTDARDVERQARRVRPDLVHAHGQVGYTVGALRTGLPHLVTVHGILKNEKAAEDDAQLSPKARLRQSLWTRLEDWCLTHAKHIVVISPYVMDQIAPRTNATLHSIANPIGEEFFAIERIENPTPTILTVGWLTDRKRHGLLIEAVARATHEIPGLELHLIGSAPPKEPGYEDELKQLATRLGVGDAVRFLGRVSTEDLLAEYASATLLAHAALEESSPMALAQAMAAGLPIVAVDIPGVRHLVASGETGVLVESAEPAAIAATLVALLRDAATLATMGAAGRAAAAARFTAIAVARQTRDLYLEIISERST